MPGIVDPECGISRRCARLPGVGGGQTSYQWARGSRQRAEGSAGRPSPAGVDREDAARGRRPCGAGKNLTSMAVFFWYAPVRAPPHAPSTAGPTRPQRSCRAPDLRDFPSALANIDPDRRAGRLVRTGAAHVRTTAPHDRRPGDAHPPHRAGRLAGTPAGPAPTTRTPALPPVRPGPADTRAGPAHPPGVRALGRHHPARRRGRAPRAYDHLRRAGPPGQPARRPARRPRAYGPGTTSASSPAAPSRCWSASWRR